VISIVGPWLSSGRGSARAAARLGHRPDSGIRGLGPRLGSGIRGPAWICSRPRLGPGPAHRL